jgi:FtsH-binding integral membrane protein
MIGLYILSALVMLTLEYFILLKLYKRSKKLEAISLIVAPLMILLGIWITLLIQGQESYRINPFILFAVIALLELPLSLYGYEIQPNATVIERVVVAGSFGVVSVMIAQAILDMFYSKTK